MTSRRDFLKGVAAAGTLSGLASKSEAQAAQAEQSPRDKPAAMGDSQLIELFSGTGDNAGGCD